MSIFKEEYLKMDEDYGDSMYRLWGPTLLSYPMDVDSSRLYMLTSHLKQCLTLLNPDVPRVQTGYENLMGKYNRAYKFLEGKWEVKNKITKFRNGKIYSLVLYNATIDKYDVIEKTTTESLTEKFGYVYNTDKMDNLKIGDVLKDEVLYKSTSYDENMNYRFGKNAKVYYSTSTDTIEDAIVVRKSWAESVRSVEIDKVQVSINSNDVLLNLYGNDDIYKPFPEIGEMVNNSTLCATRRVNNSHLLYDFQLKNMQEICDTDVDFFTSKNSYVYDIDVFYNGDDPFPDNIFYRQLKDYYDDICEYADKIYEATTLIKESGSKYTDNVSFIRSKYKNFNDKEYKWKNKDKAFNNIIVEFKVKSVVELEPGSKLTGRYGNKGVISRIAKEPSLEEVVTDNIIGMFDKECTEEERKQLMAKVSIVDDEKMPYTEDYPIDIIMNCSGAIRRLNSGQLYEVELNFCSNTLQKYIKTLSTLEEKKEILFKYLSLINKDQYDFFLNMYNSFDRTLNINNKTIRLLDKKGMQSFINDVEENGIYLVKPPDANIRYTTLKSIYNEFPFIKPLPLYVDIFGTKKRRIIRDGIVGDQYIIILKHNSNKSFSARSTFRVNRSNLPAKDQAKKDNRSSYSKVPVRIGEAYNLFIGISGRTLSEHNIFTRSSSMGRKSLGKILETDSNPLIVKKLKIQDNYINANADILNAKLKSIGLRIKFLNSKEETPAVYEDYVVPLTINGYTIYDSPVNKEMYVKIFYEFNKFLRENTVVETYCGQKKHIAWQYVFNLAEIKEFNISDETKEMIIASTHNVSADDDTCNIPNTEEETDDEND